MDLLDEIQKEIANYRSLQKANDHVESVKYDLDKAYSELHAIEVRLDKEYREYEKLEGQSLKGFFYKVLGNKEKQLEKERQEYLQLSLKFDEKKESIKLKEFELEVLRKKVAQFKDSKTKLDGLKEAREAYLLSSSTPDGSRLRLLLDDMDTTTRLLTDIDEALHVGGNLEVQVNKMLSLLRNARNWGRWDMSGGNRGRMYKYHKHSNIDRAKDVAYRIQNDMVTFDRELRDVYPEFTGFNNPIEIDRFNTFSDIFFDNLISDWIVQQKIVNSYNNVKAFHDRVARILQSLEVDRDKAKELNLTLAEEKDRILTGVN